ncbi:MAG: DNA primase [bacterium]|nr:DNA primase [bacterium]
MAISEQQIEEIRDKNNIVDVIGDYLKLKRAGANFKAICPFHSEKTPSFLVSPAKQIFHCFGCGKGGNVFTFIQLIDNISFYEAVKKLAERAGILIQEETSEKVKEATSIRKRLYEINQKIANLYNQNLIRQGQESPALTYLQKRGITSNIIKKYQLGYAGKLSGNLFKKLVKLGFTKDDLLLTGNFFESKTGDYTDRFHDRIIFPILDIYNNVMGFGGRIFSGETETAKYINSPDSPVYNKSRTLYGIQFAKNDIRKENKVFIVEGYFDVITLQENGILNVVASSGTALTPEQIHFLKRFTEYSTLIYDADSAGINAAIRGAKLFEDENLYVDILSLPENEDPDSYLRKHKKDDFLKLTSKAIDLYAFQLKNIFKGCNKEVQQEKIKAYKDSIQVIKDIKNPIILQNSIRLITEFFGIEEVAVRKSLSKQLKSFSSKSTSSKSEGENKTLPTSDIIDVTSEELIRSLFEYPERISFVESKIKPEFIQNNELKDIFINLCKYLKKHHSFTLSSFVDSLENSNLQEKVTEIAVKDVKIDIEKLDTAFCDYVTKLQKNSLKLELKHLENEMKELKRNKDPRLPSVMQKYLNLKKTEKNRMDENVKDLIKLKEIQRDFNNLA